eukprot:6190262-Pleurochrysis_carterae.AAC.3
MHARTHRSVHASPTIGVNSLRTATTKVVHNVCKSGTCAESVPSNGLCATSTPGSVEPFGGAASWPMSRCSFSSRESR